jgi:N-acetylglutamate synthase
VISIADLERVAALGWQAPERGQAGNWLLRAAGGFTGRANSALAAGGPGIPLEAAVEQARRWYAARGLPAMIAVPFPLSGPADSAVDRYLARRGWRIRPGPATVMTASPQAVASRGGAALELAELAPEPDDGWLSQYHYRGRDLPGAARAVLMSAPWQAFGSIRDDGRTLAVGRVAAGGGWAGITAVEVAPGHRRRGLATAMTAALAAAAARHGAAGLYLQVEDGNEAARRMYLRAGFTCHHRYHYRVGPAS